MSNNSKPWFLANEKKERSNFWKSRSSGYSSSNFWLKDSIFEKRQSQFFDEKESVEAVSKYDHFQLAQYQRAISNFVRILTGRSDIIVKYNSRGESYTDGKTITLSPNIKENEFDTAVGLALHEASHILHTDFSEMKAFLIGIVTQDETVRRKTFFNIVEDLYIDAMTYRDAPGYRGYYSSLYQKFFGDKKIVTGLWSKDYAVPTWDNYLFHVCNIRNPKRNLDALPGLREVFDMLSLSNITRLNTTKLRIKLANEIHDHCAKYIDAVQEMMSSQKWKSQGNGGGSQDDAGGTGASSTGDDIDYDTLNEMLENMEDGDEADGENGSGGSGGSGGGKFVASNGINIQEEVEGTNYIDMDKLTDSAKKSLQKLIDKQREFVNGEPRKGRLAEADQKKVDAYASVDVEKKIVGADPDTTRFGTKKGVPLYIIRDINDRFIETVGPTYGIFADAYHVRGQRESVINAINRGKQLAKKLQLRNEERSLKTSRLDSGKIDKRLLHEIGFDNFDIFSKININSYKPSFIHLSLDQSGSMGTWGCNAWKNSLELAAMFATASKLINNIHLVVTVRSTGSRGGARHYTQTPYMMTIFDSKKHGINHIRKYFPMLTAHELTPEGLAFDGIMKETLQMAQNTDAYFINICDGEPCFEYKDSTGNPFNYRGAQARKHSNEQMRRMEAGGIKFITYFIGDSNSFNRVKECYGDRAVHLHSPKELVTIAKTMNKKLLSA